AVIEDAVVVSGETALPARHRPHVVLGRVGVVWPRLLGEPPRERDAASVAHDPRGGHSLRRRYEVQGAELIVLAPASPVAAIAEPGSNVVVGRQLVMCHGARPAVSGARRRWDDGCRAGA